MKAYHTNRGILVSYDSNFYVLNENWDDFINDDAVLANTVAKLNSRNQVKDSTQIIANELMAPVQSQEIWASGVTYYNSKLGREEESKESGGSSFYARVYEAERPELFFKATAQRTVG
ncbi:MAG: 2-hydroxyhepta-2,4-diene-1,7-dioate isomerase, partial [Maribacter sp.]